MFSGLKRKKNYPIKKLALEALSNDDSLVENIENDKRYVNICFIALASAYVSYSDWSNDKYLKKYVKVTSEDVLAFEIAVFTMSQALQILEQRNPDADDFDLEDAGRHEDISDAMHFMMTVFEKEYDDIEPYFNNRVRRYSDSVKPACEAFSFNLTNIKGAQDFAGLKDEVQLDLQIQLNMMAFVMAYRKAMVPAFIESVDRLSELPY